MTKHKHNLVVGTVAILRNGSYDVTQDCEDYPVCKFTLTTNHLTEDWVGKEVRFDRPTTSKSKQGKIDVRKKPKAN